MNIEPDLYNDSNGLQKRDGLHLIQRISRDFKNSWVNCLYVIILIKASNKLRVEVLLCSNARRSLCAKRYRTLFGAFSRDCKKFALNFNTCKRLLFFVKAQHFCCKLCVTTAPCLFFSLFQANCYLYSILIRPETTACLLCLIHSFIYDTQFCSALIISVFPKAVVFKEPYRFTDVSQSCIASFDFLALTHPSSRLFRVWPCLCACFGDRPLKLHFICSIHLMKLFCLLITLFLLISQR